MKIKVLSDLHFEFGGLSKISTLFSNDDVDIFVVPGDLSSSRHILETLIQIDDVVKCPVLFVAGNHEYYGSQKCHTDEVIANHPFKHIVFLNEDVYIKEDPFTRDEVVFLGSTGWWTAPIKMAHIQSMNDFNRIYDIKENANGNVWGKTSKLFFKRNLEKYKDKRVVCISHNLPSFKCISPKYKGSFLNDCFANHYDDMIMKYNPLLWLCGHTHDTVEMVIGTTRVMCNPYGYKGYNTNPLFNGNLIVEV